MLRHVKKRSLHHLSTAPTAQKMVLGGWKQHTAPPGGSRTHCARSVSFALTFFGLVLTWLVLTCFFFLIVFRLWLWSGTSFTSETSIFFPPPFILHFLQTGVLCLCIALPFAFFFFFFFLRCVEHLQSFMNNIISLHFVVHVVSSDESISACDFCAAGKTFM